VGHKEHKQIRFLLGFLITALSLYALYITHAFKVTPELMLVPEEVEPAVLKCNRVSTNKLEVCLPDYLGYEVNEGIIRFYSIDERISGTIEPADGVPFDKKIRSLMDKPLVRMSAGDLSEKSLWEILKVIFKKRYNPIFIGIRSGIVPSWMRGDEKSRIVILKGVNGIGFSGANQMLGINFYDRGLVVVRIRGSLGKPLLPVIMKASTLR
jgi:hypothetical protein